jgi:hypothetical protein
MYKAIDQHKALLVAAVRAYLAAIPHHIRDVSKLDITIGEARDLFFYRVDVALLVETRSVERKRVPYRGWKIPAKTKDETNLDEWSYSMPRKDLQDLLEPKTSIVADSQSLHDCATCSVTGWLKCTRCNTRGKVECSGCRGQGRVTCTGCSGAGRIQRTRVVVREEKCKNCGFNTVMNILSVLDDNPYTRARACRTCGGSGVRRWKENEAYTVDCKRCGSTGKEACGVCKTTGVVTCAGCTGKGKVGCPECDKCKRVVSYLAVTQNHKVCEATQGAFPPFFKEWLKYADEGQMTAEVDQIVFEDVRPRLDLTSYEAPPGIKGFGIHLSRSCSSLVHAAQSRLPDGGRVVQERLRVLRGRCIGLTYSSAGTKYTAVSKMVVFGSGCDVSLLPHVSPATRWLCDQLRRSKKLAAQKQTREAALILGLCREAAAADPVCDQHLQNGISTLPDDIVEMSKRVRFSLAQIVFISGAAAILTIAVALSAILNLVVIGVAGVVCAGALLLIALLFGRSETIS